MMGQPPTLTSDREARGPVTLKQLASRQLQNPSVAAAGSPSSRSCSGQMAQLTTKEEGGRQRDDRQQDP